MEKYQGNTALRMPTRALRMPTRRAFLRGTGAVLGALAFAPAFAQQPKWRIAFANVSDEIPFGATVAGGFRGAAAQRPNLDFTFLDNHNDAERGVANARAVAAARFDLFIEYNTYAASGPLIARIMEEEKVRVLSIQIPIPGAPLFAVDNAAAGSVSGRAVAEAAKARWPREQPVVLILGLPESGPMFVERSNAAKTEIRKVYPDIALTEFSSRNDPAAARQIMLDTLTRNPERKVLVWVHVDFIALAAVAAIRSAGREGDVVLTATGGDKAGFAEIRRAGSPFLGTYSFFPELWAEDVIPLAERMLKGEGVPARSFPKRQLLLTAQNIDQYYPA